MAALKFLVVDDASFIRDLIKKTLRDNYPGCTIQDANSARRACAMAKNLTFDVILSDWEMPEMTGEEFLRWIRQQPQYEKTPFIMVSSRGEKEYVVKAVQAGVNDYLGKPFTAEEMVGKINKQLARIGLAKKSSPGKKAQSSLEALTGGSPAQTATVKTNRASASDSASVLMGASAPASAPAQSAAPAAAPRKKNKAKRDARAQAELVFAGFRSQCIIQDISLQTVSGIIKRSEQLPTIMENAVVSVVQNDGSDVARLNGYVFALKAADNRPDCGVIQITIRFVDDDPAKLEQLSRFIAS